jgi:hypothetical protein
MRVTCVGAVTLAPDMSVTTWAAGALLPELLQTASRQAAAAAAVTARARRRPP